MRHEERWIKDFKVEWGDLPGHCSAVGDEEEPVGPVEDPQCGYDAHSTTNSYQEGQVHPSEEESL